MNLRTAPPKAPVTTGPVPSSTPPTPARRKQRRWNDDRLPWLRPVLSLLCATVYATPLYLVVANVLKPSADITATPWTPPTHPTFENLRKVLSGPDHLFWSGLLNSLQITVISMVAVTVTSAMLGYAIARSRHIAARALLVFLLAGLMVPGVVILNPLVQILRDLGLMNTLPGLVLVSMGYYVPFGVFLFAGFVRTVPVELEEAAAIDGAGRFRIFWSVVFPLLRPATASVLIFLGVYLWSDFLTPLIILGPENGTTVTVGVYRAVGMHSADYGQLFAFMSLASLPILVLFLAFQRHFVKGLTGGATKG
ncbi:carbohydrate ABC transporter permease [Streptomyces sp. NRRL WC-3742]|uniref:carbohydrate ABC transporter permease n=1 Tax=Streptomyces sp. NRRL WC-3742 TaxID=1463934 RepID=UPI000AF394AE|nr:carbohydrate ABC transporter permease [Streptomyces sp. NRRL WC-3742]